ncbi:MAG: NnrU protein, partial [Gammaproteobacteria bacterium]
RIKRIFRHPMLTGVFIWAVAHLLVNGTTRALVLFGGLGIWALLEIVLINKRDGAYTKPDSPDFSEELKGTFISAGFLLFILFLHPYFAGVTPFPR